ncbi:MAG TPA: flavocytochrome c [Tissierellia bacterium]|jgi:fumarate reductase flavoprotein subunit|nr:flavocytochrome c [Tissierellia bacterium]
MKKHISFLLCCLMVIVSLTGCTTVEDNIPEQENNNEENNVSSVTTSTGDPAPEYTETLETDVLVLGGGGTGLTSALTAAEKGKNVILVEKLGYLGGATMLSAGIVPAAETKQQKEANIVDNQDLFARDIFRPNSYSVRKDLVYTVTENAKNVIEWLEEQGVVFNLVTNNLYYGQSNYRMHVAEGGGQGLTSVLIDNANNNDKIEVMLNSPAIELAVEDDQVIGAFVKRDNKDIILIKAENTVLCTSGFGANKEMIAKYIPEMINAYPYVAPGATGEGIIWGQNLGAAVANMKAYQGHGVYSEELKGSVDLNILYRGGILVNKNGERFTNEHKGYSELSPEVLAQPDHHVYMVFNQANADETAKFADYDAAGILIKAETLEELATALNVDQEKFKSSINDYLDGIEKGQDSLNRTFFPEHFDGPYYAIEITADLRHTQGGLVTDTVGHVLREDGTLIKGLYAAGGVMEGFSDTAGPGYMSGNGLLQAFVFGRLAGEYAATTTRAEATIVNLE